MARAALTDAPPRSLLNGIVTLSYAENPGAFLGLGARLPERARIVLGIASGLLVVAMGAVLLARAHVIGALLLIGISLLIGGGMGNLIDRITNGGRVIDFMVFRLGPFQTGVLNVADIAITVGAIAAALSIVAAPEPAAGRDQ
jgi:signal peptidase II